jgi:ABC-type multidrug transport system fused ATPase/permease subunit
MVERSILVRRANEDVNSQLLDHTPTELKTLEIIRSLGEEKSKREGRSNEKVIESALRELATKGIFRTRVAMWSILVLFALVLFSKPSMLWPLLLMTAGFLLMLGMGIFFKVHFFDPLGTLLSDNQQMSAQIKQELKKLKEEIQSSKWYRALLAGRQVEPWVARCLEHYKQQARRELEELIEQIDNRQDHLNSLIEERRHQLEEIHLVRELASKRDTAVNKKMETKRRKQNELRTRYGEKIAETNKRVEELRMGLTETALSMAHSKIKVIEERKSTLEKEVPDYALPFVKFFTDLY